MKRRSGNSSFPNPSFAGRFTVLLSKKAIGKPRVPLDYPLTDVNRKCLPVLKNSLVEWKLSKKIAIIQGNLSLLSRINWCKKQSLWGLRACACSPFESREKCIPARGKPRLARAWLYKVCHRLAIEVYVRACGFHLYWVFRIEHFKHCQYSLATSMFIPFRKYDDMMTR